ncbi:uncharacterized protein [Ptychodera flava]|uniref:uncharacterized protein n=1 Tax=Ptychodera flava TaxID=63121 RepID=UPI00396A167D
MCSKITDYCLSQITIFKEMTLQVDKCSEIVKPKRNAADITHLSLRQFEELVDIVGLDGSVVPRLIDDVVGLVAIEKLESITSQLLDDYEDEFWRFDIKLRGEFSFSQELEFFDLTFRFVLGTVPVYFGFGSGGTCGVKLSGEVALVSMTLTVKATPAISAAMWGSLGVWIPLFAVEMKITGYLITASFPTQAELQFNKFPLELRTRIDLTLVPIKLDLRGLVLMRIKILRKEKTKVLLDLLIWSYTSPQIDGNILDKGDLDPDTTPPMFTEVSKDKGRNILKGFEKSGEVTECDVYQVPGRDYTDPAFSLEVAVGDENSEVELTFCVGSYKTGCDLLKDQPMGGSAVVIAEMLPGGLVTHFTVQATDSANNAAVATCLLPTYDVTLPEGRVTPEFHTTSRHDILRASAVVYDDSELNSQKEGVGFGFGIFSDQIVPWSDVTVGEYATSIADQTDPLIQFGRERKGRLGLSPYEIASYSRVTDCAAHCLKIPPTRCLSFNYDFGTSGTCEILSGIEGSAAIIHESGLFHHYEKLGVGHSSEFYYEDLTLRHGDVYYMQLQVVNVLGYENIISSEPIIADFTPPNPGIIENELIDQVSNEPCLNFVPDEWKFRCVETTQLANYRVIVDGPGSATVFNGHTPYLDLLYTRANTFVSANWDGFHDYETGIYGYTWTIGSEPCLDDIHPHKDPHAHLFDESEWTHIGLADSFEEELADGKYHVSVRAINKVDFGGPMATTVCHSVPYTIDRSPPIVHEVTVLGYDEDDCTITAKYNLSDDLSHIKEISFGLGKSPRDVYLLDWKRESNITHIAYPFCVPDGVPTWVKIRAMNHVQLTTVGHAASPIIVDTSPPIPGEVFDGTVLGHDIDYQSSSDVLCVSWRGFYDEESGIEKYSWYAGSSPGSNDTVPYTELGHSDFRACKSDLNLNHNETYYSTIVAFNAGHKKLRTAITSDGVLVDNTAPMAGWIKDGLHREHDMIYSPVATTVSASWDDFSDPESNIKEYVTRIWRENRGKENPSEAENIYTRDSLPAETKSINWHHFHLKHGDYVYTEIEAINYALTGTKLASSGFTVDLTEPIFSFLGDGDKIGADTSYTESLTQLTANWDCEDNESGVDHYKVTIYQTYGGLRKQFYPSDGKSHEIVDADKVIWRSPSTLQMINGGLYNIRVSAVNGAGLGNVRDTSGVIVDSTPPQMLQISIGAMTADEDEELIDGYVMQTDTEGIRAFWEAVDFESGIFAYWIAVGTSSGATDVLDFTRFDPTNGGYIDGLTLKKFSDAENPGTEYYVACKAENGAGTTSEAMVSR